MTLRPEDRIGLRPGTWLARANSALYKTASSCLHFLPNFRGKIPAGLALYRVLGLQRHHIVIETTLRQPISYRMRLDLHSMLECMAYLYSGYEVQTVMFLARCYKGTGYFLDIGANIGLITIPFVKISSIETGTEPVAVCVEAIRSNCKALAHNVRINDLDSAVKILCCGLGDRDRDVEIQVEGNLKEGEGTGTANILADQSVHPCERIRLEITTVNRLIEGGNIPRDCELVKIDVDGYDLKVLQGGTVFLEESRPIIFGEFSRRCLGWHDQTPEDVAEFVHAYSYDTWVRDRDSWKFVPIRRVRRVNDDLLLIPEERVADLDWCLRD
jgi:FkbM family methyltransferase